MNLHRSILRNAALMLTAMLCAFSALAIDIEIGKSPDAPDGFEPIRMTVRTNGVYYVDADTMASLMSVDTNDVKELIASGGVTLRNMGEDLAYMPDPDGEGLYFYGAGIDDPYTDINVYWLMWYDGEPIEMKDDHVGPTVGSSATESTHTEHYEENLLAGLNWIDDIEEDHWTWDYIISEDVNLGTNSFMVDVRNIVSSGSASLKVKLFGVTTSGTEQEHHALISVNGTDIGGGSWTGVTNHEFSLSFSQGLLQEGSNSITVGSSLDSGAAYSIFRVDSFDLTYTRKHIATNNQALIQAGDNQVLTVDGFTDDAIYAVRLTDEGSMDEVAEASVSAGPTYRISFEPVDDIEYAVFSTSDRPAPDSVTAADLGALKSQGGDSRYVVITSPDFSSAAQELADHRDGKGLRSEVIDIEDIYNDFNHGIASPWAIRSFFAYSYTNWSERVEYAVLAGEGTYDYKNYKNGGDNIIPPPFVMTPQGLYAADIQLGDIDNDNVPEVAVGRLPVLTEDELQTIVDKIIRYESSTNDAPWQKLMVLVADKEDDGGAFHESCEEINTLLPGDYTAQTIYRSDHDRSTVSNMFKQALNDGAAFVNYFGHGGSDQLSKEKMISSGDIAALSNSNKLAILTSMSCLMGQYSAPSNDCLGEVLLLTKSSGIVAIWAPSGSSMNQAAEQLNKEFYEAIFADNKTVLGDAIIKALSDYKDIGKTLYMMEVYNLLGDPALEITQFYASYSYLFTKWQNDVFSPEQQAAPDTTDWDDDPDGDGVVNLAEYAFLMDPNDSSDGTKQVVSIDTSKPVGEESEAYDIVITFDRRKGLGDVTFLVEATYDFVTWTSDPEWIVATEAVENVGDDTETVTVYVKSPEGGRGKAFVRLRLLKN